MTSREVATRREKTKKFFITGCSDNNNGDETKIAQKSYKPAQSGAFYPPLPKKGDTGQRSGRICSVSNPCFLRAEVPPDGEVTEQNRGRSVSDKGKGSSHPRQVPIIETYSHYFAIEEGRLVAKLVGDVAGEFNRLPPPSNPDRQGGQRARGRLQAKGCRRRGLSSSTSSQRKSTGICHSQECA